MTRTRTDGRHFEPELLARAERGEDGRVALYAPRPGLWRGAPPEGSLVRPGDAIGELEVLGLLYRLRAPAEAFGVVGALPEGRHLARRPVDHGTRLMRLDPEGVAGSAEASSASARTASGGPVFTSPLGGRYYARPSPGAEPFVTVGQALAGGETVALIEVMKTFNRVTYAGAPATVAAIVPKNGDDLEAGDVILELAAT